MEINDNFDTWNEIPTGQENNSTSEQEQKIGSDNDLISFLNTKTVADDSGNVKQDANGQPKIDLPQDNISEQSKIVADIGCDAIDFCMISIVELISGETNPEKFVTSERDKKRMKEPAAKLIEHYKINISPAWMFGMILVVVYAPMIKDAIGIRMEKEKQKKLTKDLEDANKQASKTLDQLEAELKANKARMESFTARKGAGRPKGSTKKK